MTIFIWLPCFRIFPTRFASNRLPATESEIATVSALPDAQTSHAHRNRQLLTELSAALDALNQQDRTLLFQAQSAQAREAAWEDEKRRNVKLLAVLAALYERHAEVRAEFDAPSIAHASHSQHSHHTERAAAFSRTAGSSLQPNLS